MARVKLTLTGPPASGKTLLLDRVIIPALIEAGFIDGFHDTPADHVIEFDVSDEWKRKAFD